MKSFNGKSFDVIVKQYKALRSKKINNHIDFCVQQRTLIDAIEVAAKAIDENNKIHSHQRRVGRLRLNLFAKELTLKEFEIKVAKNFDELLYIIETVECDGIADLTHYDTAVRIGAYLEIFPDKIYLHAGTKVGANYLLGNVSKRKSISLDELPADFLKYDLTASEFEDILCIFKGDFKHPYITAWQSENLNA